MGPLSERFVGAGVHFNPAVKVMLNPQPLPPGGRVMLNPQPLPPRMSTFRR